VKDINDPTLPDYATVRRYPRDKWTSGALNKLLEMGIPERKARNALRFTNANVGLALDLLVDTKLFDLEEVNLIIERWAANCQLPDDNAKLSSLGSESYNELMRKRTASDYLEWPARGQEWRDRGTGGSVYGDLLDGLSGWMNAVWSRGSTHRGFHDEIEYLYDRSQFGRNYEVRNGAGRDYGQASGFENPPRFGNGGRPSGPRVVEVETTCPPTDRSRDILVRLLKGNGRLTPDEWEFLNDALTGGALNASEFGEIIVLLRNAASRSDDIFKNPFIHMSRIQASQTVFGRDNLEAAEELNTRECRFVLRKLGNGYKLGEIIGALKACGSDLEKAGNKLPDKEAS
jgi:hypothetical protein